MIDPLASLGLASNIVQLVDFGVRLVDQGREIAAQGSTEEHQHLMKLAAETSFLCNHIKKQEGPDFVTQPAWTEQHTEHQSGLGALADRTKRVADDLSRLLSDLSLKEELETALHSMKRLRASSGKVVRKLCNGIWKSEELNQLKSRMEDLQRQMLLQLVCAQSASTESLLRSVNAIAEYFGRDRIGRLAEYEEMFPHIDITLTPFLDETSVDPSFNLLSRLHLLRRQAQTITRSLALVDWLRFDELRERSRNIAVAHPQTYSWVFNPQVLDFSKWLSDGNGIYWITGKPGSGKSTLMKYITEEDCTCKLLQEWAGNNSIFTATHYFWNAGSPLQKSRMGLLRTLLYHIVRNLPQLGPELFPDWFAFEHRPVREDLTRQEMCDAIRAMGTTTTRNIRFCFFIDGLDEYVGEYVDLVELISDFASNPQIKICVSSRPWNVFTQAYHRRADGELRVQDLSADDIRSYIHDSLFAKPLFIDLKAEEEEECILLLESIAGKAQGVFLWVVLVVRSLLRGLTNGDDLIILNARLDSYPDSLNGYFQRMFGRIEKVYRAQSARLLLAASAAEQPLPVWSPCCLEAEAKNLRYALGINTPPSTKDARSFFGCKCPLPSLPPPYDEIQDCSRPTATHYCFFFLGSCARFTPNNLPKLTRYLDARCGDLLEVTPEGIAFIHRSARDFLFEGEISGKLEALAGPTYDTGISLASIALARAKMKAHSEALDMRTSNADLALAHGFLRPDTGHSVRQTAIEEAIEGAWKMERDMDQSLYREHVKSANLDLFEELHQAHLLAT